MKSVSKSVGIATLASFAMDVYGDYQKYGHSSSDFGKAIVIDTAFAVCGVAAGFMIATVASPVGLAIGAVVVGTVMSCAENKIKHDFIGY